MFRWQTISGVALGLLIGFAILSLTGSGPHNPIPAGPILSECDGHLQELVIQYEPSAKEIAATLYRGFLGALEGDVLVHALCPTQTAFDELRSLIGPTRCQVMPIIAGHPITTWSRDRWVALKPDQPRGPTTLWSPLGEAGQEVWPARAGDQRVALDLAAALGRSFVAKRGGLYFDGGDFLADSENVFVAPRVLQRNIQHTVNSREEFLDMLGRELKRRLILLDEAPDHHAGMFMASIGNRTMLVADPGLARKVIDGEQTALVAGLTNTVAALPGGPDFTPETQRLFDAVARRCAAVGYNVVRIPVVPARDRRTYLTYVNVLMDQESQHRLVYLPSYRGCEPLNAAARGVWESLGYEVHSVDCTAAYRHFGCLHCLVNVLARSTQSPKPPAIEPLDGRNEANLDRRRFEPVSHQARLLPGGTAAPRWPAASRESAR